METDLEHLSRSCCIGTIRQNLDETPPCGGTFVTRSRFELSKCHIMSWLKEPWDAKMTAFHQLPSTICPGCSI